MIRISRVGGWTLAILLMAAWAGPVVAAEGTASKEGVATAGPGAMSSRAAVLGDLLRANREAEAAEVLRAYRAEGATDQDVRLLLCHVRPLLDADQKDTANDRLRALDPAAPVFVGGNVSRPEILENTPPQYTEVARKARLQGTVVLQTVIGTSGYAESFDVLKGLPMGLDKGAIEAVRKWRFKPAALDGVPVPACYVLTVNFQIQDKPEDAAGEAPPQ
ncbi:MAG TPA: energy transducer TonB [Thermoanaerobaculia bacterium]|nr:energy transducer TonB [Thermoanaerobaculia bacterium]